MRKGVTSFALGFICGIATSSPLGMVLISILWCVAGMLIGHIWF